MLRHQHFLWFLSMWGYSLCCPSSCTCHSNGRVYCNNPQQMFDSIPTDIPSNTLYLHLDNQLLRNLSSLTCNQFPNLQDLYINNNQIEVIQDTDFLGCSSLTTL
ncbi:reticulon-4 receptor-like [Mytilus trossulus]|uniref:reticulon-4 receptor-like n=1 Tax=Mytilus trossulus TaxID=6551 RepID=UPI00300624A4